MTEYRFSPKSCSRYVPYLLQLTNQLYPARIEVFMPELSTETVAGRLRDTVKALLFEYYTHPRVDVKKLATLWPQYVVRQENGVVVIIPRIQINEAKTIGSNDVIAEVKDLKELAALALLLSHRVFQGRVRFLGELTEFTIEELTSQHDIAIVEQSPNVWLMF